MKEYSDRAYPHRPALPISLKDLRAGMTGDFAMSDAAPENRAAAAANARQFLLVALSMNLLALLALLYGDLGMVPGLLWGVGILGGAAGVSFIRGGMGFSLFVMAVFWAILCVPGLNLALLVPLYRKSENLLADALSEAQREETLSRARERSTTPLPVHPKPVVAAAVAQAAPERRDDTIEFTPVRLPQGDGDGAHA